MATTNLQDNVNWLLIRASIVAKQRLMQISEVYDLTPMQALTLCALEPGNAVPMSQISELLACDPSSVTGIIERLSVGSYIERREGSTDRRIKTIRLTDAGIKLRESLIPQISEKGAPNLARLTPEQIDSLKKLLRETLPEVTSSPKHSYARS
jgi:DNA-binding MarR family transcriptional regulator